MSITSKASQRITALLDDNSFVEIGAFVTARATDFDLKHTDTPSDGVITGYGSIGGSPVYVYSQDASVLNGTVGEMHAKKIANIYDLALKTGTPVIGLLDSAGLRLQESTDALNAFGELYKKQALASGVIPQLTGVFGGCGGGLAVLSAMSDFTFMEEKSGRLFVNSPNALAGNTTAKCDTSAADFQCKKTGNVDVAGTEEDILAQIRLLVSMLPANNTEDALCECEDDLNRVCAGLEGYAGDTGAMLTVIADGNLFVEVKKDYAPEMVTGFIKLDGQTVGAVANRSEKLDEEGNVAEEYDVSLSPNGCEKAAEFVKFCDAFNIPVITITNVTGFKACECCESRIAKAAATLTYAFADATVPKINVVIGKAYGTAYTVMNSKATGADITIAWPGAEIGCMDAKLAAKIMYEGQGADLIGRKAVEYAQLQNSVTSAARRGYVDQIVEPADTRKYVIGALEMLFAKREERPSKKHGTV